MAKFEVDTCVLYAYDNLILYSLAHLYRMFPFQISVLLGIR
jgi:hypothetical protein